jgi:hypothetical protein
MRSILTGVVALLGAAGISSTAEAQTLKVMKSLDAPHYDGQRTTWSPSSDIVNMFQDTLVALDWDGKTRSPISPSRGRSARTARPILQAARRRDSSAAARSSPPPT